MSVTPAVIVNQRLSAHGELDIRFGMTPLMNNFIYCVSFSFYSLDGTFESAEDENCSKHNP